MKTARPCPSKEEAEDQKYTSPWEGKEGVQNKMTEIRSQLFPLLVPGSGLTLRHKLTIIKQIILPIITYYLIIWGHLAKTYKKSLNQK